MREQIRRLREEMARKRQESKPEPPRLLYPQEPRYAVQIRVRLNAANTMEQAEADASVAVENIERTSSLYVIESEVYEY